MARKQSTVKYSQAAIFKIIDSELSNTIREVSAGDKGEQLAIKRLVALREYIEKIKGA